MLNESAVHKAKRGKCWEPGGGGTPYSGLYGEAPPWSILKGRKNRHFSIRKGHRISCEVEEVVAKAKYIKISIAADTSE